MLTLSVTVHPSDRLYLYHLEGDEVCVKVELVDALLDLHASHHVGMSKVNDDLSVTVIFMTCCIFINTVLIGHNHEPFWSLSCFSV